MDIELLSFITVSFLVAISPGPSVIYVVSYSLRYGSKAGIISTLGINAGSIVFVLIAAFGLSSLLVTFPEATAVIQLFGGFYVIYLAAQMWPRNAKLDISEQNLTVKSNTSLFTLGFVTSLLNPKDILFYTAFIPIFIPTSVEEKMFRTHFLILAFSFMTIGFITKSMFAIFAGYTKMALASKNAVYVNYISSMALLFLGIYLVGKSITALLV